MSFLRFTKRKAAVYGDNDFAPASTASAVVLGTTDLGALSLHEQGVRQGGNLVPPTVPSPISIINEPGPSGHRSNSAFLSKLAGQSLSTSTSTSTSTGTTAVTASTSGYENNFFTSTTSPPTNLQNFLDSASKRGKKTLKRRKEPDTSPQPFVLTPLNDFSRQQSNDSPDPSSISPPDDPEPNMSQRLAEAARRARIHAARHATLEASVSEEAPQQMTFNKPLPSDPQTIQFQPHILPSIPQLQDRDSVVQYSPQPEVQLTPDPNQTLPDPTILALEEILRRTQVEQEKLRLQVGQGIQGSSVQGPALQSNPFADPISSPTIDLNMVAQPPPYRDTSAELNPVQEELLSLRLQLDEYKIRVDVLTKEKLQTVQQQHEEATTILQQFKQSRTETQRVALEQRRLAGSLTLENEKLKEEKQELLQRLQRQFKDIQLMDTRNKQHMDEMSSLRSNLRTKEAEYAELNQEKANWQAQIDAMQHRLSETERRVRCLDQVTRQRFQANQGGYASVARTVMLHHSPHVKGPSMDVVRNVDSFNDEVFQTSTFLVENLDKVDEPAFITQEVTTRARQVWGLKVVSMLEIQARDPMAFNFLLMQSCLQVFITHWCMQIIEGLYPLQASFSDILVELTAQTAGMAPAERQQICGKQVKIISTESASPDFDAWVNEVIGDLSRILLVGGVKMRSGRSDMLPSKLLPLIKIAYDLRLALAEKDICGGLELAAPSPDLPFHPDFMQTADDHALQGSRKKNPNNPIQSSFKPEYIVGTSALGLKRTLNGQPGVYELVVKPRVVLISVLETTS